MRQSSPQQDEHNRVAPVNLSSLVETLKAIVLEDIISHLVLTCEEATPPLSTSFCATTIIRLIRRCRWSCCVKTPVPPQVIGMPLAEEFQFPSLHLGQLTATPAELEEDQSSKLEDTSTIATSTEGKLESPAATMTSQLSATKLEDIEPCFPVAVDSETCVYISGNRVISLW
ncbi:hypothetical protein H1C71_013775 [Ictidomys tridecemlineatus]|nr:hypothetical protein H1C71_013775 [Ictidomys tridecemlineatus]